jgi:GTP pyrophosphokinase
MPEFTDSQALTARFEDALAYAARLHARQVRKGSGIPYVAHLLSVAALVIEDGGDEDQAIAALLHDAVEDQGGDVTRQEIRRRFGDRVAAIVDGCTDADVSPKPPWRVRKEQYVAHLADAPPEVQRVSAADKLHNARALLQDYRDLGEALWERFTGSKEGVLWYYAAIVHTLRASYPEGESALVDELARTVAALEELVAAQKGSAAKYRWILFDADGTLFDYERAEDVALETTFCESGLGYTPARAEAYKAINGQIWTEFEEGEVTPDQIKVERFLRLFAILDIEADAEAFAYQYLHNLGQQATLIEGAEQVIQALVEGGEVRLALITNGLRDVQRARLARSPLRDSFAQVVISEEVGAAKPAAKIFDVAFQGMGYPERHEVLIVGDSLSSDMQGGSDYGIDTCWYNPGHRPRPPGTTICYEIHALHEVLDIVGGASKHHNRKVHPAT